MFEAAFELAEAEPEWASECLGPKRYRLLCDKIGAPDFDVTSAAR